MQPALRQGFEPTLLGERSVLFGTLPSGELPLSLCGEISTAPEKHNTRHATPARALADWEKPQKLKVTGTWGLGVEMREDQFLKILEKKSSRKM